MFERPDESIWSLTVHEGTLAFVAPHGTFPVLDLPPAVASIVSSLPAGTEVRCRCAGKNVRELRVLEVVGLETNLTKRAGDLPDAVIDLDSRLMLERARRRIESGNVAGAVDDLGKALRAGHDGVLDVLDRLPAGSEKPLLGDLAAWTEPRPVNWRALRHLSLTQWTSKQVQSAFDASLKTAGRFGGDPGIDALDLLAELARRGLKTQTRKEKLARLRRAKVTETAGIHRLDVDIENARVVGACERGVYVAAGRTLYLFTVRGRELARWKVLADRVVGDIALLIDASGGLAPASRAIRLSDGVELFTYEWIERHDHELVCGATSSGPWTARQTRHEVRRVTGERVVDLGDLGDDHDVWWDRERIYVVTPNGGQTIDRTTGAIVATSAPARSETLEVHTQSGSIAVDAAQTIWRRGQWDDRVGGGWQVYWNGQRTLALASTEPGAAWSLIDLAVTPESVDIAPPWLVVYRNAQPILLLPLASLSTADQLQMDGKWFARRSERTPVATLSRAVETWCAALVEAGIAPCDGARSARVARCMRSRETQPSPRRISRSRRRSERSSPRPVSRGSATRVTATRADHSRTRT